MVAPCPKGKEKAANENNFSEPLEVSEENDLSGKEDIRQTFPDALQSCQEPERAANRRFRWSQLPCQAPGGSPGAAVVRDQLHLLPQKPEGESRSTAGEGSPVPRAGASHCGDTGTPGAAVVASMVALPLYGVGGLASSSLVLMNQLNPLLCHRLKTAMNRDCGLSRAVLSPSPLWWKCTNFSSDLTSCYLSERKRKEGKE